ncbi:MAG: hypothetical protein PHV62_00145 [Sulfuricurvum sp.]|nr:hypothetical protein [Sulfuricurvum sp.]
MKQLLCIAAVAGFLSTGVSAANYDIGISGSDRGIDGFSLSVGNYYNVPRQEIMVIERSMPREEMSVVYYLASRSHRDARFITDLRLSGMSWWDISFRLGLDPRTLYVVESRRHSGPPYGQAYGYDKHNKYRLRDSEIVDLVNVRFLSDYHHISVDDVIDRRRTGENYNNINEHYRGNKDRSERREERKEDRRDDRGDKGHGNPHER